MEPSFPCGWMGPCDEALANGMCGKMMLAAPSSLAQEENSDPGLPLHFLSLA